MRFCLAGSACRVAPSPEWLCAGAANKALDKPPQVILYRTHTVWGGAMVAEVPGAIGQVADAGPRVQAWPVRSAAYYGLFVIMLATALNFLDAQVFGMLAQRIKIDLGLTDEQLGFLIGPANVIFYVLVGIPLARLVDIYPRKYVLAGGITLTGGITALGGLAQNFAQ